MKTIRWSMPPLLMLIKSNSIHPTKIIAACLMIFIITGCQRNFLNEFVKTYFPFPPFAYKIKTDRFEFEQSLLRLNQTACPDLRGMYSFNATMHDVLMLGDDFIDESKHDVRSMITSDMRVLKKNFTLTDALPIHGAPDPDVFWIEQDQDGNSLEISYWNQPDLNTIMDGKIASARLYASSREFFCKNGDIYFNAYLYTVFDGKFPENRFFPAKMTLSKNGNILYFVFGSTRRFESKRFMDAGTVYSIERMYEHFRVVGNQEQNQTPIQP